MFQPHCLCEELKKQGVSGSEVLEVKETFEADERAFLQAVDSALTHENEEFAERKEGIEATVAGAINTIIGVSILTFIIAPNLAS